MWDNLRRNLVFYFTAATILISQWWNQLPVISLNSAILFHRFFSDFVKGTLNHPNSQFLCIIFNCITFLHVTINQPGSNNFFSGTKYIWFLIFQSDCFNRKTHHIISNCPHLPNKRFILHRVMDKYTYEEN